MIAVKVNSALHFSESDLEGEIATEESVSRQAVVAARHIDIRSGRIWRREPRWVGEVEELGHINLRGVTFGERRQVPACFDQLQHRGVIGGGMRNVSSLCKWRDYDQRHAKSGASKIAGRIGCRKIARRNAVRLHCGHWDDVIVRCAAFVEAEYEDRILPRRTCHQRVDQ